MQFIIVADKDLAPFGRQLAHSLSEQEDHDGGFWTIRHYIDNEAHIRGDQPVIFLGDNEVTKSFQDVLPQRFAAEGTKCWYGGTKAILTAKTPVIVSREEVDRLKTLVKAQQEELRKRNVVVTAGLVAVLGVALGAIGIGGYVIYRLVSAQKRRVQEYRRLQYQYAMTRFAMDELDEYVRGMSQEMGRPLMPDGF
ncbi:MAG: hypothetical protein OXP69_22475 [Spirochaetaceae bacterium]|nr:hypothetical protein [Spirochaetaceae bacterium]